MLELTLRYSTPTPIFCKARRISARDAVTDSLVSLFNPRTQSWEEHFTWNQDFTLMLGMTPAGRATIAALQLNRSGLVN